MTAWRTRILRVGLPLRDVAFVDDAHLLASDGEDNLWSIDGDTGDMACVSRNRGARRAMDPFAPMLHPESLAERYPYLSTGPNGAIAMVTAADEVRARRRDGSWVLVCRLEDIGVPGLAFSGDGALLLVATYDTLVVRVETGEIVYEPTALCGAWLCDRRLLIETQQRDFAWVDLDEPKSERRLRWIDLNGFLAEHEDASMVGVLSDARHAIFRTPRSLLCVDLESASLRYARSLDLSAWSEVRLATSTVLVSHEQFGALLLDGCTGETLHRLDASPSGWCVVSRSGRAIVEVEAARSAPGLVVGATRRLLPRTLLLHRLAADVTDHGGAIELTTPRSQ